MKLVERFTAWILLGLSAGAQEPPRILQIYCDRLKPGSEAEYRKVEEDAARLSAQFKSPHPYLAIESLTGRKEVWFLNGFESSVEQKLIGEEYAKNTRLVAALNQIPKRKEPLVLQPLNVFGNYRPDLSRGAPWTVGQGRFLVIAVTKSDPKIDGTVFETPAGIRFVVTPAGTREDAEAKASAMGADATIFAVRPYWSYPARDWVAADPAFWRSAAAQSR
jgi:hypothetical protein